MFCKWNIRKIKTAYLKIALLFAFVLFLPSCGDKKASPFVIPTVTYDARPNVLLITIDTCRADRIGAYDFAFAHTQSMDRLAAEGVRCDNAIAAAPITLPSHSSILTGLLPPAHGVRDNGNYALSDEADTLAERLKESGYSTHAIVSAEVLNRRYNLTQGFDEYMDDLWTEDDPKTFMIRDRAAQKTAQGAIEMLDRWSGQETQEAKPFFMWMHLFDPHQPWVGDVPEKQLLPTPYDVEIAQADDGVEAVIQWLRSQDILDNTLVIITADHGESLGEHGEDTHSIFVYDATVKIPMIWRYPAQLPQGLAIDAPTHQIDIVPTILSLLELPAGSPTQGRDLSLILQGDTPDEAYPQYSESKVSEVGFGMAPLHALRYDGYKYIEAPRPELYNLVEDPKELKNRYTHEPEQAEKLKKLLDALITESEARALSSRTNPMDETTLEMLDALGYLASDDERASMGGMDPKDGIKLHTLLSDARHQVQQEKWQQAEATARRLLERSPGHISAQNILALILWNQKRLDEAIEAYEESLRKQPNQHRILLNIGLIQLEQNNVEKAVTALEQSIQLQPRFVESMVYRAYAAMQQDDDEAAQQWNARALAESPESPRVNASIAFVHFQHKEYERALPYYEAALAIQANHYRAALESGLCYLRLKRFDEAIPLFEQALAMRSDRWEAPYNIACIQALSDAPVEALQTLGTLLAKQDHVMQQKIVDAISRDSDLKSLRELPEFATLQEAYRSASPQE